MRKTCTSRASTQRTQLYVFLSRALHQTGFLPIGTPHVADSLYIILYPTLLLSPILSRLLSLLLVSPSLSPSSGSGDLRRPRRPRRPRAAPIAWKPTN